MPAHIFVCDRENYEICIQQGITAVPNANGGKNEKNINDQLISRMSIIKEDDYILFYITHENVLMGVYQVEGTPFYDDTVIWPDRLYPYRIRFHGTNMDFTVPLHLHDIYDLQNEGKIWSFALKRASGTNAMFSISNDQFDLLVGEFSKLNPFSQTRHIITRPSPVINNNLLSLIHLDDNGQLKYEAGMMAYFLSGLTRGKYQDIFGVYSDYLSYIPTSIGSEMDVLLMFNNPLHPEITSSYTIIEMKQDLFDTKACTQLIGYETWFMQKRAHGDQKMVRSVGLAKRFSDDVIQYVRMRAEIEKKPIQLVEYTMYQGELNLKPLLIH